MTSRSGSGSPLAALPRWQRASASAHLGFSLVAGAVVAVVVGVTVGWKVATLSGWVGGAAVFLVWTWTAVWSLGSAETASHAQREDPSRSVSDVLLLTTAVVSLLAVGLVIFRAKESGVLEIILGVASVIASWAVVHTVFTLRYTRLFYAPPTGGVDFNMDQDPTFRDFAYLAFTVGMTFQVSDTDITSSAVRVAVLRHALISYVFGAFIIAVTINLVAGLSK